MKVRFYKERKIEMSRALEYLKRRLRINDEEAEGILAIVHYLDNMDNGENMLCYHGLECLTEKDEYKFVKVWDRYQDMVTWDTGELEWDAIEEVYGEGVRDL